MSDSIEELTKEIREFSDARGWHQNTRPKDMAISISLEANELLELFQWVREDDIPAMMKEKFEDVSDELADVVIYCLQFAQHNGINLGEAIRAKMQKNGEKYPA